MDVAEVNAGTRSDSPVGSTPLRSIREERFAQLVALGVGTLEAGLQAGYRWQGSDAGNKANGRKLSQRPAIRARVDFLRHNRDAEAMGELRVILHERLMLWHDRDIADFYETVQEPVFTLKGERVLDRNGDQMYRAVQRLKPFDRMTPEQRRCIKGLTYTERGPQLELYSHENANKELRRLHGLDGPVRSEVDMVGHGADAALEDLVGVIAEIAGRIQALEEEAA